jgi:hypothetical protein
MHIRIISYRKTKEISKKKFTGIFKTCVQVNLTHGVGYI